MGRVCQPEDKGGVGEAHEHARRIVRREAARRGGAEEAKACRRGEVMLPHLGSGERGGQQSVGWPRRQQQNALERRA